MQENHCARDPEVLGLYESISSEVPGIPSFLLCCKHVQECTRRETNENKTIDQHEI